MAREPKVFNHVQVARSLGSAIVLGELKPGDALPTETEFAAQRGVARNVVREALRILSAKGLIVSRRKAGTHVRSRDQWNLLDPDVLAWMFGGIPSSTFVKDLFELRMMVEPEAAALAAQRRSDSQLAAMTDAMATMETRGLVDPDGQAADQRFHAELLAAAGNELLVTLSGSITAAVRWTTFFKYRGDKPPSDSMPQHRALLDAIAARDVGRARKAAIALIEQARDDTEVAIADAGRPA